MAYSTNPNLPRARALALKLLLLQQLPLQTVANKCGVHRCTVYRWKKKWLALNTTQQLANVNRPTRSATLSSFRLMACRWSIPTLSSQPKTSPRALSPEIVARVLELRNTLKRCGEVIWHYLVHEDGVRVSLSSVHRILKRHGAVSGRKKRVRSDNPKRPYVANPGELVQTDTVYYICPLTKRRRYVYTVIDIYTRMTYAEIHDRIGPVIAARVILNAQKKFGFRLTMVQADNGLEFSRYFERRLKAHSILTRHSRLHRPNDNAHIERFNRTIQDECLGRYITYKTPTTDVQKKLDTYLAFYNTKRVHLSLQYKTPLEMLQRS
ncbi:MAG TPA: integrase core domain-containing protein [Candidatus Saccharimonadales bacterium]|nr:integrase core domain-containing protein [Candidatus Saccharimonadales bacterium]